MIELRDLIKLILFGSFTNDWLMGVNSNLVRFVILKIQISSTRMLGMSKVQVNFYQPLLDVINICCPSKCSKALTLCKIILLAMTY